MGQKKINELDWLTTVANTDVLVVDTGIQTFKTAKSSIVSGKQDTLVSGANIKTVNGTSLLGPGNIPFPTIPTIPVTDVKVNDESVVESTVAEIEVPTKVSDLTNDSGFITGITSSDITTALGYTPYNATNPAGYDVGTLTGITMNGASKGTSGIIDLGTVLTSVKTVNGNVITGTGDISLVSVSNTGTSVDEVGYITINSTEYKLAGGGGSGPASYIKDASVNNKVLTLTKQDDSTVTFTDTGSIVSGTSDGTNWQTITIDGTTKAIGGGSGPASYIKSASVSGDTLTLTKQDDTTVTHTASDNSYFSVVNGAINLTWEEE